jgi:hypothetical protein
MMKNSFFFLFSFSRRVFFSAAFFKKNKRKPGFSLASTMMVDDDGADVAPRSLAQCRHITHVSAKKIKEAVSARTETAYHCDSTKIEIATIVRNCTVSC